MPQIHVRPYAHAFGGAAPTLEALLSPGDAFMIFNDFLYATQPAASSGAATIPGGIGGDLKFDSEPDSSAPTILALRGGGISFANSVHGANDGTVIASAGVFNPFTDDIWLACRAKVDVLTDQFFFGLALSTPAVFWSGAGAVGASKYLGVMTASTTTPTLTTNGDLRAIAKTTASSIFGSVQHTMAADTWVNIGLKITARSIRLWTNGVDRGVLAYTAESNLYHMSLGVADAGNTDIVPSVDWIFAASTRR